MKVLYLYRLLYFLYLNTILKVFFTTFQYNYVFFFFNVIHKNHNRRGTVICLNTPLNYVFKLIVYCRFLPVFNINESKI